MPFARFIVTIKAIVKFNINNPKYLLAEDDQEDVITPFDFQFDVCLFLGEDKSSRCPPNR